MYNIITTEYINDTRGKRSVFFFSYRARNDEEAKEIINTLKHDPTVHRIEKRLSLSGLVADSWDRDEKANIIEKLAKNKSFAKLKQA